MSWSWFNATTATIKQKNLAGEHQLSRRGCTEKRDPVQAELRPNRVSQQRRNRSRDLPSIAFRSILRLSSHGGREDVRT